MRRYSFQTCIDIRMFTRCLPMSLHTIKYTIAVIYYTPYIASRHILKHCTSSGSNFIPSMLKWRVAAGKKPPFLAWLKPFTKTHRKDRHLLTHQAINYMRLAAGNPGWSCYRRPSLIPSQVITKSFEDVRSLCADHEVEPAHICNCDETGVRIAMPKWCRVFAPNWMTAAHMPSSQNWKSLCCDFSPSALAL